MYSIPYVIFVLVTSMCVAVAYRGSSDENVYDTHYETHPWKISEDKLFRESGICVAENRSFVALCESAKTVMNLTELKFTNCFCDIDCYKYNDCCMNVGSDADGSKFPWQCREVGQGNISKYRIYVHQMCPENWTDDKIRTLCEVEVVDLQRKNREFSYLQDIPVKSIETGIFYRNVYCAMCNGVSALEKWEIQLYCNNNNVFNNAEFSENEFDFSQSIYEPRSKRFLRVFVKEHQIACRINIHDFKFDILVEKHKPRLCKPAINTCSENDNNVLLRKCNSYTSFVYERKQRKVYKNFHCALCNRIDADKLTCLDPKFSIIQAEPPIKSSLRFLFDFNFGGGNNQLGISSPCKLSEGFIWDRIMKKCVNFTCGSMFERKGLKCIPRVTDDKRSGLNNTCLKRVLSKESFTMYRNRSVLIAETNKLITANEYEINEKDGYEVISVNVCAEEGSYLLNLSQIHYLLDEVTLSLSIICLILHLLVYGILKELRNCPGKILMSLSSCILCGHIFLLVGQHINNYWLCYICSVLTYFGYLSSFIWMHVMAFDIYRTFSVTQRRNTHERWKFIKYGAYSWLTAIFIATFSVVFDNLMDLNSEYRPVYGNPVCWFNQKKGLLVYFVLPIFIVLTNNVVFFTITAFRIRKVSKETKRVKNFSDRVRYLLYIKLTVVLGLTWLLGILAGILETTFLWYIFIIFNGLQGVFIFVSFTLKRKILKKLAVKLRIHSHTYEMGKESAVRRAIYSSLSNLSTLHTTLTTQLPPYEENQDILKAVRKFNPY